MATLAAVSTTGFTPAAAKTPATVPLPTTAFKAVSAAEPTRTPPTTTASSQNAHHHNNDHNGDDSNRRRIAVLPPDVVAQIAAGEVVPKPAAAVKELLENALDAGAREIRVSVTHDGGYAKLVVSDNGCGMTADDLPRAVLRHATSKLRKVSDLQALSSFGFRGEALASIVTVAKRLTLHSMTMEAKVGHSITWVQGSCGDDDRRLRPLGKSQPRTVGTTVTVEDLFYNMPHRQRAASREDYPKLLQIVQNYAILYAAQGVGLICEKIASCSATSSKRQRGSRGGGGMSSQSISTMDLHTSSGLVLQLRRVLEQTPEESPVLLEELKQRATKEVIAQVYGSALQSHLTHFCCTWTKATPLLDDNNKDDNDNMNNNDGDDDDDDLRVTTKCTTRVQNGSMQCWGFVSHPWSTSSNNKFPAAATTTTTATSLRKQQKGSTVLVLFINRRLVESRILQRRLEEVYTAYYHKNNHHSTLSSSQQPQHQQSQQQQRPFLFLSLTVPASTVDVNVHPTKREVTLLYLDEIVACLVNQLQQTLSQLGHCFGKATTTTPIGSVVTTTNNGNNTNNNGDNNSRRRFNQSGLSFDSVVSTTGILAARKKRQRPVEWTKENHNNNKNTTNNNVIKDVPHKEDDNDDDDTDDDAVAVVVGDDQEHDEEGEDQDDESKSLSSSTRQISWSAYKASSQQSQHQKHSQSQLSLSSQQHQQERPSKLIRTNRGSMPVGAMEPFLLSSLSSASASSKRAIARSTIMASSKSQDTAIMTPSPETQDLELAPPSQTPLQHQPDCPLANGGRGGGGMERIDLTQPGAFALAASSCTCRITATVVKDMICMPPPPPSSIQQRPPLQRLQRLQLTTPMKCTSVSGVESLRKSLQRCVNRTMEKQLRTAHWVGVVSAQRCLLQIGPDLILLQYHEAACELFYQLALHKCSDHGICPVAQVGGCGNGNNTGGIDIRAVIADLLQVETNLRQDSAHQQQLTAAGKEEGDDDDANSALAVDNDSQSSRHNNKNNTRLNNDDNNPCRLKIDEMNVTMADQAATCLLDHADVLEKYFSIGIYQQADEEEEKTKSGGDGCATTKKSIIVLRTLPVLLDQHMPCPHGLPLFLLRLATEVDWTREKSCFRGICRELGAFYATVPTCSFVSRWDNSTTKNPQQQHQQQLNHPYVRHVLFPAITTLLLPTEQLVHRGFLTTLTTLTTLYRTFERC